MTDLSPAQAIAKAFDDRYELLGPLEDDWQEQCLAAAIRAASARMMRLGYDSVNSKYLEGIEASSDLLDQIATELEGHQ